MGNVLSVPLTPPILKMPYDIMQALFSYFEAKPLRQIGELCHWFWVSSERLRYRTIDLVISPSTSQSPVLFTRTLLEKPHLRPHVRNLKLRDREKLATPLRVLMGGNISGSGNVLYEFHRLSYRALIEHLCPLGLGNFVLRLNKPSLDRNALLTLLFSLTPSIAFLRVEMDFFRHPVFFGDGAPGCVRDEDCRFCQWGEAGSVASFSLPNLKCLQLCEGDLLKLRRQNPKQITDYPMLLHHIPGMLNARGLRRFSGMLPGSYLSLLLNKHKGPFQFDHLSLKMTMYEFDLLKELLARSPHLTKFEYEHYWAGNHTTFRFDLLHDALLNVQNTLQTLRISTDEYERHRYNRHPSHDQLRPPFANMLHGNFGSLHDFPNLKTLDIPGILILPIGHGSHAPQSQHLSTPTIPHLPPSARTLHLSKSLPPSLECLTISDCMAHLVETSLPQASLSRSAFNAFHLAINRLFPPRFRSTQRVLSLVRLREISVRAKVSWLGWSPAAFGEVCGVAREGAAVRVRYEDEVCKVKLPERETSQIVSSVSVRRL